MTVANATDPQADLLGSINRIWGPASVERGRNYRGTYGFTPTEAG